MAQGGTINSGVQLPLAVTQGGTGLSSMVGNGILYGTSSTTIGQITPATSGVLVSNSSAVPIWLAGPGVSNYALISVASGTPTWSTVPYPSATGWTTFTPTVTLVGGAGNTTPTFTTNSGRYSQVGNVIEMTVYLNNSSGGTAGAGTGQVTIALPVTAGSGVANGTVMVIGNYLNNATNGILIGNINASSTTIALSYFSALTTLTNLTGADLNHVNTRQISFTFFYEV
jgi:predicted RecA/RadA family phage recombinase